MKLAESSLLLSEQLLSMRLFILSIAFIYAVPKHMRSKDYNVGGFNLACNWHCGEKERQNGRMEKRQCETIVGIVAP